MGGKGGPDVYQSPYSGQTDDLGFQTILGMLSGQGITPSPALNSSTVAQQLGGNYDNKSGDITMSDGTQLHYNPLSGQFEQQGTGGGFGNYNNLFSTNPTQRTTNAMTGTQTADLSGRFQNADALRSYSQGGGSVYDRQGNVVHLDDTGSDNPYVQQANKSLTSLNDNVYNNPASSYNLFNSFGSKAYNPTTGQYEDANKSAGTNTPYNADYYMNTYGQHLNNPYQQYGEYSSYNYKSPSISGVDNVSKAARDNEYQGQADNINTSYRDTQHQNENYIASQGGSLNSGRAARLRNDAQMQHTQDLSHASRDVNQEYELRNYNDASHVRDMQAAQDADTQKLQGQEYTNAYNTNLGEHQNAFNMNQTQGNQRLAAAEGINSNLQDRAFQELQANRQAKNNQMTALLDMLRVYGGEDSTAASLAAAQANAVGSALGGLAQGVGSVAGGFAAKPPK